MYKGGLRDVLSNYRPISDLSVTSKILEGAVRDQVTAHLEDYNLLSPLQQPYCRYNSLTAGTTALLQVQQPYCRYNSLTAGN